MQVQFIGEEGVDEGGVTKEFFQLLLRELFDPAYGMFTYDHATRLQWFHPSQLDMEQEFRLVGIMIGLAIYNSQLLDLAFPRVLYRKLVGQNTCLSDLEELFPDVHRSLKQVWPTRCATPSAFSLPARPCPSASMSSRTRALRCRTERWLCCRCWNSRATCRLALD